MLLPVMAHSGGFPAKWSKDSRMKASFREDWSESSVELLG